MRHGSASVQSDSDHTKPPIVWVPDRISVGCGERASRTESCLCVGRGGDDDRGTGYGRGGAGRRRGSRDGGGRDGMTITEVGAASLSVIVWVDDLRVIWEGKCIW